jgi:Lipoprotein LpqB beta-propeller domain/Sporulation and spore germination
VASLGGSTAVRTLRRMCVLAAVVASVAGCVGMPSNGPAEKATASPQSPAPDVDFIGPHPSGPQPGGNPSQIVQEFLLASASYPTYAVAKEYLVGSASRAWNPGWAVTVFSSLDVPKGVPATKGGHGAGQQVTVNVTGTVQASFDGSGQYVSAQSQGQAASAYPFNLVKVDGQWRITNPPNNRMLTTDVFPLFYKAQDLYFAGPQDDVLVPDSVFVPLGATVSDLVDNLVTALADGPKTLWLEGAADTELPSNTTVLGVTTAGSTVTVNLGGQVARASARQLGLFSAQLVWTLTGSAASLQDIQSVVLERNGVPWTPPDALCPGQRSSGSAQTLAAYQCFDPYPSSPAGFYYIDRGQLWARCGTESQALQGLIGSVVPVVSRTGVFSGLPSCTGGGYVHEGLTGLPSLQPASSPAASMAAVSPDGKYLAVVSSGNGDVYIGALSGQAVSFPARPRLAGGGVTALSWDGNDDLWVAQSGSIVMLPPGKGQVPVETVGSVSDLSVAPDGVRIAFIAQTAGLSPALYLAAIGGGQQSAGRPGPAAPHLAISDVTSIGPNLTRPVSLAWYDADDLIVLNNLGSENTLWEVPVDGQQAQELPVAPSGVTSITADGAANVLVAGLSGNNLAVSTSLDGPWYQLGEPGQDPAYPG